MREYEIRLSKGPGKLELLAAGRYFSDTEAIRAAERICREGESIEVWRGETRVFAGLPRPKPAIVWLPKVARI